MMDNGIHRQSSIRDHIRDKFKNSICCFTGNYHPHNDDDSSFGGEGFYNKLTIPRTPISPSGSSGSPSSWFKKSPMSNNGSEFSRVRGRSQRLRGSRKNHNRQSQSADFSYDPSSYALNFESENAQDDFPIRNFSSRLPRSPPRSSSKVNYSDELPKEIVGCS
ncbi:hypothetical protein P8452_06309 [Trifolium repens]|nr:hypothetical protein P8452_06309 [Trifolium repens]